MNDESPGRDTMNERRRLSRREFLRTASAPAVLATLGIVLPSCTTNIVGADETPGITIDGNRVVLDLTETATEDLTREGGFLLIRAATVMAINVDGSTIRAFTSTCTHLHCTITSFREGRFHCPCHGSRFNSLGEVVQGPAEDDLDEFAVERDGDVVIINR